MAEADNLAAFVKLYSCMFSVWGLRRVRPFACGRHSPPSTFHPYSLSLHHGVPEQSTEYTWESMPRAEHDCESLLSLPGVSLANPQTVHGRRAATCSSVATRTSLGDVNCPLAHSLFPLLPAPPLSSSLTFVFPVGSFTHCLPAMCPSNQQRNCL